MSNIFKTNSRFSSLFGEDKNVEKNDENKKFKKYEKNNFNEEKNNLFKYDKNENRYNRRKNDDEIRIRREKREIEEKNNKELEKKEIERKIAQDMSINNFPELVPICDKPLSNNKMNFANILKNEETICNEGNIDKENIDEEYMNLKPGWTLLKRDKITGKTIIKHKPTDREIEEEKTKREKTDNEIAYDIAKRLAELYEKRTQEYIELWGYDEWERMFRFPNYDYEYFDKLDEKYAQEMEELEELEFEDMDSDEEF